MVTTTEENTRPVVHDVALLPMPGDMAHVTALVGYEGESPRHVTFVGSMRHGGPVVMVTGFGSVFVDRDVTLRCGAFGVEWVMRFFGQQ